MKHEAIEKRELLESLLKQRILLLDGAMGTMIQSYKLTEADYRGERFNDFAYDLKGNNDLLTLTQPKIIHAIHQAYLEAGSDILETNTFNSTSITVWIGRTLRRLASFGLKKSRSIGGRPARK